jgi:hypothetical protein
VPHFYKVSCNITVSFTTVCSTSPLNLNVPN